MIMVMIILNVMAAVDFALRWSIQRLVYIKYGQTIVDEYLAYLNFSCSEILIETHRHCLQYLCRLCHGI